MKTTANGKLTADQTTAIASAGQKKSRFISFVWPTTGTVYYSERGDGEVIGGLAFDPDPAKTFVPIIATFPKVARSVGMGLEDPGTFMRAQFSLHIDGSSATSPDKLVATENPAGAAVTIFEVFHTGNVLSESDWITMARYEVQTYTITYGPSPRITFICEDFSQALGDREIGRRIRAADFPNAPPSSLGRLIPVVWGKVENAPCFIDSEEAKTTLDATITGSTTEIFVDDVSAFPTSGTIIIGEEKITYPAVSIVAGSNSFGTVLSPAVRGTAGTVATDHPINTTVTEVKSAYRFIIADHNINAFENFKMNGDALQATDFVNAAPHYELTTLNGRDIAVVDLNRLPDTVSAKNSFTEFLDLGAKRDGKPITAATNASPIVITVPSHDFVAGDRIFVEQMEGQLGANDQIFEITVSGDNITLTGSTASGGTYTRNGTAYRVLFTWEAGTTAPLNTVADAANAVDRGEDQHTTGATMVQGDVFNLKQENDVSGRTSDIKSARLKIEYAADLGAGGVWPSTDPDVVVTRAGATDAVVTTLSEPADTSGDTSSFPSGSPNDDTTPLFVFDAGSGREAYVIPLDVITDTLKNKVWQPRDNGEIPPGVNLGTTSASCTFFTNVGTFLLPSRGTFSHSGRGSAQSDIIDPGLSATLTVTSLNLLSRADLFNTLLTFTAGTSMEVTIANVSLTVWSAPPSLLGTTTPIDNSAFIPSSRVVKEVDITGPVRRAGGWSYFDGTPYTQVIFPTQSNGTTIRLYNIWYEVEVFESTTLLTTADSALLTADVTGFVGKASTLSADIDDAVTTIPLVDTSDMDSSGIVRIGEENISYAAKAPTNISGGLRARNGTSAAAHSEDDDVFDITDDTMTNEQLVKQLIRHPRFYDLADSDFDTASLTAAATDASGELVGTQSWKMQRWLDQEERLRTLLAQAVTDGGFRLGNEAGKWLFFEHLNAENDAVKALTRADMVPGGDVNLTKERTNLALVANQVDVVYHRSVDITGDRRFQKSQESNHIGSQAFTWGVRRAVYDAEWVRDLNVARTLARRMTDDFSQDRLLVKFPVTTQNTALEIGDIITASDSFSQLTALRGRIVGIANPGPNTIRLTIAISDNRIRVFEDLGTASWLDVFVGGERWIAAIGNVVVMELDRTGLRIKGEFSEIEFDPQVSRSSLFGITGTTITLSIKDAAGSIFQAVTIDSSGNVQCARITEDLAFAKSTAHTFITYIEFSDAAGVDLGASSKDIMVTTDLSLLWETVVAISVGGQANGRLELFELFEGAL